MVMTSINISHQWHKNRRTHFLFALCCSLLLVLVTFQYTIPRTIYEDMYVESGMESAFLAISQLTVKQHSETMQNIPKKSAVLVHPDPIIKSSDTAEEIQDERNETPSQNNVGPVDIPESLPVVGSSKTLVVPVTQKAEADPTIYTVADEMPYLSECAHITDREQRYICSREKLYTYIREHLKYPIDARTNKIEGKVLAGFIINENGQVTQVEILREPHRGMGNEVIRVLQNLPSWQPGKMSGKKVKVRYRIPVEFSLMD